jgi:hypothetical protein
MSGQARRLFEHIKCIHKFYCSSLARNLLLPGNILLLLVLINMPARAWIDRYIREGDSLGPVRILEYADDSLKNINTPENDSSSEKSSQSIVVDTASSEAGNQLNSHINIKGNNNGNITIVNSGSQSHSKETETKENPDTVRINNRCYYRAKFEFKGYLFSDFVAIDKDKPNGLIQSNAYLCYTRPLEYIKYKKAPVDLSGKPRSPELKQSRWYPFKNIVVTDVTLSKIGNQMRRLPARYLLDTAGNTQGTYFNRFDLLQYSNVIAMTKVNLIAFEYLEKTISAYIDFIPVFYNTPVVDTLGPYKETSICNIAFGCNIKIIAKKTDQYSAEISYSVFAPRMFSNVFNDNAPWQIKEVPDYQIDPSMFADKEPKTIQALDLKIGYKPSKMNTETYFKFSVYQNVFRKSKTAPNMFVEIQLGSLLNFEDFFKSAEGEEKKD